MVIDRSWSLTDKVPGSRRSWPVARGRREFQLRRSAGNYFLCTSGQDSEADTPFLSHHLRFNRGHPERMQGGGEARTFCLAARRKWRSVLRWSYRRSTGPADRVDASLWRCKRRIPCGPRRETLQVALKEFFAFPWNTSIAEGICKTSVLLVLLQMSWTLSLVAVF